MTERMPTFENLEDEYTTAGWLGTIAVMENIGSIKTAKTRQLGIKRDHILRLCQEVYTSPNTVPQKLQKWTKNRHKYKERVSDFIETDILASPGVIDDQFLTAYNIFTNTDWRNETPRTDDFSRLLPDTQYLADWRIVSARSELGECNNVKQIILDTRHHIDFYIGNYDPSR